MSHEAHVSRDARVSHDAHVFNRIYYEAHGSQDVHGGHGAQVTHGNLDDEIPQTERQILNANIHNIKEIPDFLTVCMYKFSL